jgi:hypothetical protein
MHYFRGSQYCKVCEPLMFNCVCETVSDNLKQTSRHWAVPNILFGHGTYKHTIYNNYTGIPSTLSGSCVPTSHHVTQDLMLSITPFVSLPIIFTDGKAIQLTFLTVRPPSPITLFAMNAKKAWLYTQLHNRTSTHCLQMTTRVYTVKTCSFLKTSVYHTMPSIEKNVVLND